MQGKTKDCKVTAEAPTRFSNFPNFGTVNPMNIAIKVTAVREMHLFRLKAVVSAEKREEREREHRENKENKETRVTFSQSNIHDLRCTYSERFRLRFLGLS